MFIAVIYACLVGTSQCDFITATTYYPDEYGCRVEAVKILAELKSAGVYKAVDTVCMEINTKVL